MLFAVENRKAMCFSSSVQKNIYHLPFIVTNEKICINLKYTYLIQIKSYQMLGKRIIP